MTIMKVVDKELKLNYIKFQAKILSGSKVTILFRGMTISLRHPVQSKTKVFISTPLPKRYVR